jgi:uncharacterized phage protein (TIGR01671 family)
MTNRVIKFRVWNTFEKEMQYGDDGFSHPTCKLLQSAYGVAFPIMQFTGLLDKNGKEIYEGDVVGYSFLNGMHYDEDGQLVEEDWGDGKILVSWDDEKARFNTPFSDTENIPVQLAKDSIEVIGNLFETPNLLSV